jgi:hypothetical protein
VVPGTDLVARRRGMASIHRWHTVEQPSAKPSTSRRSAQSASVAVTSSRSSSRLLGHGRHFRPDTVVTCKNWTRDIDPGSIPLNTVTATRAAPPDGLIVVRAQAHEPVRRAWEAVQLVARLRSRDASSSRSLMPSLVKMR